MDSPQNFPSEALLRHFRDAAALFLWELGAVKVDLSAPFLLASGHRSPIYINCRRAISEPAFMQLFCATSQVLLTSRDIDVNVVAGGETAGIPFAAYLASALGRPMVYVRKKAKGYGLASRVEGSLKPGSRVLLVEDLITDGGSKLGFLDALREAEGEVRHALVLFDREQGGAQALSRRGVQLHAVTNRTTTLAAGQKAGILSAGERRSIDAYFADVAAWHREHGFEFEAD